MSIIINTESTNLYEEIKQKCKEFGITVSKLCVDADISRDTLANWKNKNPGTVDILFAIEKVFQEIKEKEPRENGFYCMADGDSCSTQCKFCENKSSK